MRVMICYFFKSGGCPDLLMVVVEEMRMNDERELGGGEWLSRRKEIGIKTE
jgi:hypothetical protein